MANSNGLKKKKKRYIWRKRNSELKGRGETFGASNLCINEIKKIISDVICTSAYGENNAKRIYFHEKYRRDC